MVAATRKALLSSGVLPAYLWDFGAQGKIDPANFTYAGASLRTMFDATGKLTYAPNNLLLYSNTFSNAAWNKGTNISVTSGVSDPLGGTSAWTITASGTSAWNTSNYIDNSPPTTYATTSTALVTVWIRRRTGSGNVYLAPPNLSTSGSPLTLSGSWQQFYTSGVVNSNGRPYLQVDILTSGDQIDIYAATNSLVTYETTPRPGDQVITTSAVYYGPAVEYNPLTLAPVGLRIEEARTNLLIQNASLTNAAWTNGHGAFSTDGTLFLNNTAAEKWTSTSGSGVPEIYQSTTIISGSTYTVSIYAKAGTLPYFYIGLYAGGSSSYVTAVFNLSGASNSTATQTSVGSSSGTLVSTLSTYLGNGWFRVSVSGTITSTTGLILWGLAPMATGNTFNINGDITFTGAGTESVYFASPQLELGAFATSMIPTAASSVARAADVVSITGVVAAQMKAPVGSYVMELNPGVVATTNLFAASASGGLSAGIDTTHKVSLGLNLVTYGAQSSLNMTLGVLARAAGSWSNGQYQSTNTGAILGTYSGSVNASTGNFYLGSTSSIGFIDGHITKLALYNKALPASVLQAKTVLGARL